MQPYDDPYAFLACFLISHMSPPMLEKTLADSDALLRLVRDELYNVDFRGPFLDCIETEILANSNKVEEKHELNKLADYFFSKLDVDRLRKKVLEYQSKYNIL